MQNLLVSKKTEVKNSLLQFLPEKLEDISKQKNIYFRSKKLKSTYIVDLVHSLLLKYFFKKDNEFVLSSVVLKDIYGKFYNYYIDYLVETQTLELKKNYSVGKKSRIYRLSADIINSKITRYINRDPVLNRKRIKKQTLNENNKINSVLKLKLISNLNGVDIDYDKAEFFLRTIITDSDTLIRNLYAIESIKNKYFFWQFDDYGRFHSNFTILKSFIRKNCLFLDGEEVREIDLSNSQPLFLSKLIQENILSVKKTEFEKFKLLVTDGIFYDYLKQESSGLTRDEIKKIVYQVFFGKNGRSKSDLFFKKIFPSIYNFIVNYKKINGDYKSLSYNLQIEESNFIYNKVVIEFSRQFPEAKFLTIHDSIIVPEKYAAQCKKILEDCFERTFKT